MIASSGSLVFETEPSFPFPAQAVAVAPKPRSGAQPTKVTVAAIRPVTTPLPSVASENLRRGRTIVEPAGNRRWHYCTLKRATDVVGAACLLVLFSPIMLGTLLVLAITTKGRPVFIQRRVGYLGRPFPMIKFRTMRLDAATMQRLVENEKDGPIFKNRRDPRITGIGRILRSTSIDEMPQLINVLVGHMSLVGPRPPIASEVAQYKPWQRQRLAVRPGLTCLWQISGRSEIGFEQWVRMDLWYLERQSLLTDVKLLIQTPLSVLSRRGAY